MQKRRHVFVMTCLFCVPMWIALGVHLGDENRLTARNAFVTIAITTIGGLIFAVLTWEAWQTHRSHVRD
jgi:hypothetical protein